MEGSRRTSVSPAGDVRTMRLVRHLEKGANPGPGSPGTASVTLTRLGADRLPSGLAGRASRLAPMRLGLTLATATLFTAMLAGPAAAAEDPPPPTPEVLK